MRFTSGTLGRLAIALTLTQLVAGCAYRGDSYPSGWSPPRVDASCSDIVGVYRNKGEIDPATVADFNGQMSDTLLSNYLFPWNREAAFNAKEGDVVEISWDGSAYHIRALRGATTLRATSYAGGQLACRDGWLTISSSQGLPEDGPIFGYHDTSRMLHLAQDRSLIVRSSGTIVGLAFMVVPAGAHETSYARFKRHEAASQSN